MFRPITLMTLAPGHFHAALVQKQMHPYIRKRAYVYAPLDADLVAHVDRVVGFNTRTDNPTAWELDVRAGGDYLARFLREQPGNVAIVSGRNRPKIDLLRAAVEASICVLADKPWIVEATDLPKLEALLRDADLREVLVWDMMTERHEVTNRLMREIVRDRDIFGDWRLGSPAEPALAFTSVHCLKKTVAGQPLRRPWWWFDPAISGEAMADVGTHLADLALWMVAPEQAVRTSEVEVLTGDSWPLVLGQEQFTTLTGLPGYPPELAGRVVDGQLPYAGNNSATLTIRGVCVKLTTKWEYDEPGGDTHEAIAWGEKATVTIRQQPDGVPELAVLAADMWGLPALLAALRRKCEAWQREFPGVQIEDAGTEARVVIPDALRTGHEAHFAAVLEEFVRYFHTPRAVPAWERINLLTKYRITTTAVEMARQNAGG